jgi:putative redox protein
MKLQLKLHESPFVLALQNEDGLVAHIDAASEIGGTNKGLRPMQLLAGSLAGCLSIDVLNILRKQRIEVTSYTVNVTAGRKEGIPSPFDEIALEFVTDAAVPFDKLEKAIALGRDKYCSVAASLNPEIRITTTIRQMP